MKLIHSTKLRTKKSEQMIGAGCAKAVFLILFLALITFSCQKDKTVVQEKLEAKKVTPKMEVKYATGFGVEYFEGYKLLHVFRPYRHKNDTVTYLLYPRGTEKPVGFEGVPSIQTPAKRIITLYSPHVAQVDFVNETSALVGISSAKYLVNEKVRKMIAEGKIAEVNNSGSLNAEIVLSLEADFIMASGTSSSEFDHFENIMQNGTPVVYQSGWMESSMLARAEWVKMVAALFDKEELANQKFDKIEKKYKDLVALAADVDYRPKVISGLPFKGVWYVGAGNTYAGKLLKDAGADWPWASDTSGVSLRLDIEAVYPHGLEADYWINIGYMGSKKEAMDVDSRFAEFKPVKNGNLYNNRKRISPYNEGNDYWESGTLNPHLVLSDMIKIFHPELLPDYELYYYKKLQ
ncbi:ABC transporter substrate-binding protein [Flammeovirgaceae bacterium SG7u.111]|nr:ABC transporter substrate-binding protein [Flammeovirgaceae bacterium SG7u.111]